MRPTPALGSCDLCGDLILCGFCGHGQLSDEQRSAWEKGVILLLSVILFPVAIVCATSPCTTWSETSPPIHMSWHLPHSLLLLLKDKTHFVGISGYSSVSLRGISLVGTIYQQFPQLVKNLPAMQETRVRFLDWEDLLEKGMAIHSSILAWRIPWTEEPGRLQSVESQEWDMT